MMHCTDGQLIALMEANVVHEDPQDEALAIEHLENCDKCRERLQTLSGEGEWLDDLLQSVREDTGDFDGVSMASSIVVTTDLGDPMEIEGGIQCETVRLDFLESPSHPELLGRLGRYDIEQLIGMGGFGVVFKARDSELNRVVAIKVLAPHLMSSGPARKRFAREAQASAAIVHDHVVAIHDVVSSTDSSYFVMQYVAGESLQQRVDREGPLEPQEVLRIASQMAAGLHAAHEQGLIHRDVKPANIMLEDSVDRVLISDFGLARTADDASITRSGVISGTPHYMSPEQAQGQSIDVRSDLFSMGSVIYFMCTGHAPFRAPRMMAVLNRICTTRHRSLLEINEQIPVELSWIVDRLLAKDANDRYLSASHVQQDLSKLLRDLQSGVVRPRRWRKPLKLAAWLPKFGWVAAAASLMLVCWVAWQTLRPPIPVPVENQQNDPVQDASVTQMEQVPVMPEAPPDPFTGTLELTQEAVLAAEVEPYSYSPDDPPGSISWNEGLQLVGEALSEMEAELAEASEN